MALRPLTDGAAPASKFGMAAPVDMRDTPIAGIVIARRAKLATRNVKPFADLTAEVVNPREAKLTRATDNHGQGAIGTAAVQGPY